MAPDEEYFKNVQLIGGVVRLRVDGDEVFAQSAVPAPGFSVEVEKEGPREVEVEFRSESHESTLHARVEDGELRIDKEESEED